MAALARGRNGANVALWLSSRSTPVSSFLTTTTTTTHTPTFFSTTHCTPFAFAFSVPRHASTSATSSSQQQQHSSTVDPQSHYKTLRQSADVQQVVRVEETRTLDDGAVLFTHAFLPNSVHYTRALDHSALTKDDLVEMKRLRESDPDQWTVKALATKFNCTPRFVSMVAPAPPERVAKLAQDEAHDREIIELLKRNKRPSGIRKSRLQEENRARFKNMMEEAGGIKRLLMQSNIDFKKKKTTKRNGQMPFDMNVSHIDEYGREISKPVAVRDQLRSMETHLSDQNTVETPIPEEISSMVNPFLPIEPQIEPLMKQAAEKKAKEAADAARRAAQPAKKPAAGGGGAAGGGQAAKAAGAGGAKKK